jgi:tellurite resistance protein
MIYVGATLPADTGHGTDPALINPSLPVDHRRPDLRGASMDHWPCYSAITPAARAAYLRWLVDGRQDPNCYIGYVFLYFYGLERRLLVDGRASPAAAAERESLLAEVRRLLSIYGENESFGRYARHLLDAMVVVSSSGDIGAPPKPTGEWTPELSVAIRVALAKLSAAEAPVAADWALAWVTGLPDTYLRTPATRCPELFSQLFAAQYRECYGPGVVLKPGARPLGVTYQPASGGIRPQTLENERLREVGDQAGVISTLRQMVEGATTELDPYSRYLGRHPDGADHSAAIALLPPSAPASAVRMLWSWATAELGDEPHVTSSVTSLIEHWPDASTTGKLLKADLLMLAQLLDRQQIGIEPDTRFHGSPPAVDKPIVLFRRADQQVRAPSPHYAAALATLNLGMLVAAADGTVDEDELVVLRAALEPMDLTVDERLRLAAHAALVATQPPTPAILRRRLTALSDDRRIEVGRLLIAVAAADGTITSDEVHSLERLFHDLGLDPSQIYSTLHAAATETVPDDVVTVHTKGTAASRTLLPEPTPAPPTTFALDPAVLTAKRAESARAAAQLADIFADEESAPDGTPATDDTVSSVAGLDSDHSGLFHLLVARDTWRRVDVERLTAELCLLTDGALEVLNEAAYGHADGPLWEGTDPLTIDHDIAKDMQA